MNYKQYEIIIGIDTGVNTGYAIYDTRTKKLLTVETIKVHEAILRILALRNEQVKLFVRFEDARLRKWFGSKGKEALQGAGSVKRDAKIMQDFLEDYGIPYEAVAPKNNKTKVKADYFSKLTGWSKRTSEHSRDAAALIYGL